MKKTFKPDIVPVIITALIAVLGLVVFSCADPIEDPPIVVNVTPTAEDFTISGLEADYDGNRKPVSITPNAGKSTGILIIYYEGTDGTVYAKSETAPSAAGSYAVTFDVGQSPGFNAVNGLVAGTLVINRDPATPIADDFNISGLSADFDNSPKAVTITPKDGSSTGAISIHYEGIAPTVHVKSTNAPSAIGSYAVTFDVAEAAGFNAAVGLVAGTLVIDDPNAVTPILSHYTITGNTQVADGEPKELTIERRPEASPGAITIWYTGANVEYERSTEGPSNVGRYNVTFDVTAADGFRAADGLNAGTLTLSGIDPVAADYTITGLSAEADGSPKAVSITPNADASSGDITIWYTGTGNTTYTRSNTAPSAAGSYAVTFDVAQAGSFNAATAIIAGTLIIREVINEPHRILDFEGESFDDWYQEGFGNYNERTVNSIGFSWTTTGLTGTEDVNDRKAGSLSMRLRGNETDGNIRLELNSYLSQISSIQFDYASYSTHNDGVINLYYREQGEDWELAGSVTSPSWGGIMLTSQRFEINKSNVRFKIVRDTALRSFSTVNIDNIVIIGATENSFDIAPPADETPIAGDFTFNGLGTVVYDGDPKEVTVQPRLGSSPGAITVWYEGTGETSYTKSDEPPSAAGTYEVTFDVAAATGFTAAPGLVAGTLTIIEVGGSFTVDFEGNEWAGGSYSARSVSSGGYDWTVSGVGNMDANDRRNGDRSIRFRGGNTADTGANTNRVELMDYVSGIKSISYNYASYSSHSGGVLILFTQLEGSEEWVEHSPRVTAVSWASGGSQMINISYDEINITQRVRFKIEKLYVGSGSISANIDDIIVITE